MYVNYLKRESNPNKKWNLVRTSLEYSTLPLLALTCLELMTWSLLAPGSTDWANGPLMQLYSLMYANYLKSESSPHKKWNLVCMK